MIIKDSQAVERLASPLNLINRLKSHTKDNKSMSLFIAPRGVDVSVQAKPEKVKISFNPFRATPEAEAPNKTELIIVKKQDEVLEHPSIDNLINNSDNQIKLAEAHDAALSVLTTATKMMAQKLDDIKADKLPSVIAATSKVVEGIRRERNEAAKLGQGKEVHYHFYTPVQKKVSDYEVIEVG